MAAAHPLYAIAAVAAVEPDYKVHVFTTTPNDPDFSQQWHLPKVSGPQAWDYTSGSTAVKVRMACCIGSLHWHHSC